MSLKQTPVSRNLHASIRFLGLDLEDILFLVLSGVGALILGQFIPYLSDRTVVGLPMNWAMFIFIIIGGYVGLALFKNGKPPGYLMDYIEWHMKPHAYSALERDREIGREYLISDNDN